MARFTVDLSGDYENTLNQLSTKKAATKAEILRRALITYSALARETEEEGKNVSITQDGEVLKDVLLP